MNKGAFVDAANKEMERGMKSMLELLKEFYSGETWAVRELKAGRLTNLEIELYADEIQRYKDHKPLFEDLIFKENPFLKMSKNNQFQGKYVTIPLKFEE